MIYQAAVIGSDFNGGMFKDYDLLISEMVTRFQKVKVIPKVKVTKDGLFLIIFEFRG